MWGMRAVKSFGRHLPQLRPTRYVRNGAIFGGVRHFASIDPDRDQMEYDVLIIGGGPAGLGAAIRCKQLCEQHGVDLNVCVVEKGAEIGAHILSGNIFETRALDELIPDWKEKGAPIDTPVTKDAFWLMPNEKSAITLPQIFMPKQLKNHGNYVISLGQLCRWLGEQAEEMGVEIFPGFSAADTVTNDEGAVVGVQLQDVGVGKDGKKKDSFEPGMQLLGKQVILAEGCRGSLSEKVMQDFGLREAASASPQAYGLGVKEVWEVAPGKENPGFVAHSVGWPMGLMNYGGAFLYHMKPNLVLLGMVVGLDYKNPHISPYQEFQRWKTHPKVKEVLEGGQCISYGARCLNEGGLQSIPKLTFPGGMLAGCSAGFLNTPKIKGSHNALKTGMIAGESAFEALKGGDAVGGLELTQYQANVDSSWVMDELKVVRNCKPTFKYGLLPGLAYSGLTLHITRGKEPWTFKWSKKDCDTTEPAAKHKPIDYPKPDGKLTFDLLENLSRSNTNHDDDQPAHLKIKQEKKGVPIHLSLPTFDGPEGRFCPAKVYEYVPDDKGGKRLQINAQNCVHCKCCSIKTPMEFINWTVPEGGGGPAYDNM